MKKITNRSSLNKKAYSSGFKLWSHYKYGSDLFSLAQIENIFKSNHNFQKPSELQTELINNYLGQLNSYIYEKKQQAEIRKAEKIIKQKYKGCFPLIQKNEYFFYESKICGKGPIISENDQIKIKYCIKNISGLDSSIFGNQIKEIKLAHAMLGFKKGLLGLRKGSTGTLYIHPEYSFRSTLFSFGIRPFLIIDVEIE